MGAWPPKPQIGTAAEGLWLDELHGACGLGRAPEQQHRADHRAEQDAERPGRRVERDRARQVGRAHEVLQQQLLRRRPQRPGHAVQDQQDARVPDGERAGGGDR
jgi:hypothetical protein